VKFKVGDKVKHKDFGVGEIIGFDGCEDRYAVEFKNEHNGSMHNFSNTYMRAGLSNPIDRKAGRWCLEGEIELAEAEFCAKYKNIQRTETLDLPTWEEAKIDKLVQNGKLKNGCWDLIKSFTDKMNNEMFEFSLSSDDYNQFYLSVNNEDSSYKDLFYKPLTYDNYLEACELCKKLFEGEV